MSSFRDFDSPSSSSSLYSSPSFNDTSPHSGGLSSYGNKEDSVANAELQEFLVHEQQKAQLRAQVQIMTDQCWEKCTVNPSVKLDTKTESCLDNCAKRFVDVTLVIANRFAKAASRQGHM